MELRSDCIGQKWEGHVKTLLYLIYCTFYNKILSDKKKDLLSYIIERRTIKNYLPV